MNKFSRAALYLSILLLVWLCGFFYFVKTTNDYEIDNQTTTDAIVVFGAKKQSLYSGIELLKSGYANIMLVTGSKVNSSDYQNFLTQQNIIKEQIVFNQNDNYLSGIDMFLKEYQFSSIRIVSDGYQLPRLLSDLKAKFPHIIVIPNPSSKTNQSYFDIFKEYNKYLLTYLAALLGMKNEFSLSYS